MSVDIYDPFPSREPIATTYFSVQRYGMWEEVSAWVGAPFFEADGTAACYCGFSLVSSHPHRIGGADQLQALTLAIRFLQLRIQQEVESGVRLVHSTTKEPVTEESLNTLFTW